MVESGIAIELQDEVIVTVEGNITESPTNSWGRKAKYLLTRPELLFFVDEVSSNTSQKRMEILVVRHMWCTKHNEPSLDPHIPIATSLCLGLPMCVVTRSVVLLLLLGKKLWQSIEWDCSHGWILLGILK